ncbi:MAG: SdpI family protein [Anaerolineales bacterium]|nr:SdpI family protein [Anaerolineales bacterium]
MFIVSGILLALLGVPMALGRVEPNSLYGFRVRATLDDAELWYPANRYAGRRLIEAGIVSTLAAVGFTLLPDLSEDAYAWAYTGLMLTALTLVVVRSFRYLKRLRAEGDG